MKYHNDFMIITEKTLLANVVRLCSSSVWVAKMINYVHTAVLVLHLPLLYSSLLLYPPPSQSQFGHHHLVTEISNNLSRYLSNLFEGHKLINKPLKKP